MMRKPKSHAPARLPHIGPGIITGTRVLCITAMLMWTGICLFTAHYDAANDYGVSLFGQCICVGVFGWAAIALARPMVLELIEWRAIRRYFERLHADLDAMSAGDLELIERGVPIEEIEQRWKDATELFESRVTEAIEAIRNSDWHRLRG